MPLMPDGTVIPSFMGVRSRGKAKNTGFQTNLALRMGEVKEIVYPDSPKSLSGKFVEYTVEVQHLNGHSAGVNATYRNCIVANHFGGSADHFNYTLRAGKHTDHGFAEGSKVLLLCINGQTTQSIIISGVRDVVSAKSVDDSGSGHNLSFEFNGVSFSVDKDGEAQMQVKGPTKPNGQLADNADSNAFPTTIDVKKNGNLHIYTKDGAQSILIDHENKKASFLFDQEWNIQVNKDVNESYGGTWNVDVNGSISHSSETGSWTIQCLQQSFIKSAGLQVGLATDFMVKGTTYRLGQAALHAQLIAGLSGLAAQITVAGASLTAAGAPMLIPVVGAMIASPLVLAGGAALTSAVASITAMVTAITNFEAASPSYLSLVNKSD